ncbi:hypothetical protein SAMN05892883_2250 [Jatrophihabitans sp. GAS493]|uniref:hypothetical protein n=1 Tax=Jatrophihabitans sp. GAS493 TaxID=1907575 RepID=UPI000BBFA466|nr:hypothetical protein [Jatrophihabitans sp. GAS493]SOD72937.1 hypothetical protein SAMN05892883_2250 [Jatrophihabitans sp. GAS493]
MSTPIPASTPVHLRPAAVAGMLDTLAAADRELAGELDRIASSRSPVSTVTVAALERLLTTLRPAAEVRSRLAGVDPGVLAAAIRLRRERRDLRVLPGGLR